MTDLGLIVRVVAWFAIASLGLLPYFVALRRYRRMTSDDPTLRGTSVRSLLDSPQSDPERDRARRGTRRLLWIGLAVYFLCIPLLPVLLNA
jgi:hypothetical protein